MIHNLITFLIIGTNFLHLYQIKEYRHAGYNSTELKVIQLYRTRNISMTLIHYCTLYDIKNNNNYSWRNVFISLHIIQTYTDQFIFFNHTVHCAVYIQQVNIPIYSLFLSDMIAARSSWLTSTHYSFSWLYHSIL